MAVRVEECHACGQKEEKEVVRLQGCRCGSRKQPRDLKSKTRGYGLLAAVVGVAALFSGAPASFAFTSRTEKSDCEDRWATFPGGWVRVHEQVREDLYELDSDGFPGEVAAVGPRRVTVGHFLTGEPLEWEDERLLETRFHAYVFTCSVLGLVGAGYMSRVIWKSSDQTW